MSARVGLAVLKAVECGIYYAAGPAGMTVAVANRHHMLKAGGIVGEALEELPDVHFAGVVLLVHVNKVVYSPGHVNRIIYMALDFKTATAALFAKTKPEDLAEALGCSAQTIRQARMAEGTKGHRSPPPGWEAATARLMRQKAAQLQKLADKLG
jgi:hypothetical protein